MINNAERGRKLYLHFSSFETRLHWQWRAATTASSGASSPLICVWSRRGLEKRSETARAERRERKKAYGGFKDGVGRGGPPWDIWGSGSPWAFIYTQKRDAGRERVAYAADR